MKKMYFPSNVTLEEAVLQALTDKFTEIVMIVVHIPDGEIYRPIHEAFFVSIIYIPICTNLISSYTFANEYRSYVFQHKNS